MNLRNDSRNRSESNINLAIANVRKSSQKNILLQRSDEYIRVKSECSSCKKETNSINRKTPGELTWMWCSFASILSLCFLPFFIEECNDVEIYCAECLELK